MNNLVQVVASSFLNSFWEVAAIGGAAWAVSRLLKRFGPRVLHILWVTTLLLTVIVPVIPLLRSILTPSGPLAADPNHPAMISVFEQSATSNGLALPPASILALFFLCVGALIWFATRLGWSMLCTIRLRREACPASLEPEAEELWRRCREAFSVKEAQVLRSERIAGPVTVGFAHPALLVSGGFIEECKSLDVLTVLAHECAHIKRRDVQKNLLYEIASLPIAYHPVTWFVKSQIARTREMACDDMATEKLIDRRSYAESLLRLAKMISFASATLASNAVGIFDANVLEERIMMMRTKKVHFSSSMKYGVTIGSILVLFSLAVGIGAIARPIEGQSPAGSSNSASAKGRVDLSCTYYDPTASKGVDGTCETHKGDKTHYYCAANFDRKLSEEQSGCEWKTQRAKALKGKGLEK